MDVYANEIHYNYNFYLENSFRAYSKHLKERSRVNASQHILIQEVQGGHN